MADKRNDPDRKLFAEELKAMRALRGWSREEVAKKINFSLSTIGNIESMFRAPTRDQARLLDEAFCTPGTFGRLEERLRGVVFASGFRPFYPHEARAETLRYFQNLLVPGMFQTRGLRAGDTRDVPGGQRGGCARPSRRPDGTPVDPGSRYPTPTLDVDRARRAGAPSQHRRADGDVGSGRSPGGTGTDVEDQHPGDPRRMYPPRAAGCLRDRRDGSGEIGVSGPEAFLVRDTKNRAGGTLAFASTAWRRFATQVKTTDKA